MEIPDHFVSWETCMQVKKQQLDLDMEQQTGSKLGKEYIKAVYCHLLILTYIMWNPGLDESQAGIKILGRNINNLRDADDTTQMSESKEELKSLLIRVREESEKAGLKLNIQKTKIMVPSGPITSWQTDEGKVEMVTDFLFLGSKLTVNTEKNHCSHEIRRHLLPGRKARQHIKKQRHYLLTKVHISQSYGFSSSHVLDVRVGL